MKPISFHTKANTICEIYIKIEAYTCCSASHARARAHTHTLNTPVAQMTQAIRFSSKYKEKISVYRNHIAQEGRAELRENSKPSTRFFDLKPETKYDATMGYRLRGGHHDRPSRTCSFILLHNIPYVCNTK